MQQEATQEFIEPYGKPLLGLARVANVTGPFGFYAEGSVGTESLIETNLPQRHSMERDNTDVGDG